LDLLKQHAVKRATLTAVQAFIDTDKKSRKKSIKTKCYLNAEPMIFSRLQDDIFDQIQTSVTEFIAQAEEVTEEINSCERKLGSIPDPESLEGITQQIKDIQEEIGNAKLQFELLDQEYKRIRNEIVHKKTELTQSYEMEASEKFAYEANHLLIERIEKVRYTLDKFGLAVTTKHIRRLELLILESFSQLIRKENFINQIEIDPNDYTLTLYTPNHEKLSPKSLSAGERQLLAVSVLWGLSRASGRPLPTIIDTPLSRLDGKHRQNLVDNYFYQASHQVILLSTDEEINEKYYNDLKSAIGREYHITYEKDRQSAVIKQGYFF
jgi:DNA sulfur modification protein DndD